MNINDTLKWSFFGIFVVGWAVMFALNILPDGWAAFTLAIGALLYGLPAAMKVGSKISSKILIK